MKSGKKKGIKIVPCPAYDVEGTESWLSEMASRGLQLKKDGLFAGFAAFEKCGSQKVRYRLEAARKSTSIWLDNGGEPDPEAVEINRKYDWEYVAKRGQFHVYRSTCTDGRELNTDPEVQALALNEVRKRQRNNLIGLLFWLVIYPVIVLKGLFFLFILDYHEAFTEFLAEQFAAEYYRMDKAQKNFKEMDCPELGVDYAAAYYDELHFPTVIVRQGNTVIHASFYQTSEYQVPFEEWTDILAESIRQENN